MPSEEKSSSSRINLTNWLKPKKSRQKLRKRGIDGAVTTTTAGRGLLSASSTTLVSVKSSATQYSSYHTVKDGKGSNNNKNDEVPPIPPLAPLQAHRAKYRDRNVRLDTQLGENADYTTLLHSMSLQEDFDSDDTPYNHIAAENRPPGEPGVASLSAELWCAVADLLDPKTAVCLALASKTLYARLGPERYLEPLNNRLENRQYKLEFLTLLDRDLPSHLLCIPCAQYHRRIRIGKEKLQPLQAQAANPLFHCPNARNVLNPPSRHRIAHGRSIPFSIVQLTLRAHRFGSLRYGITPESLGRRWRTAEQPSTKFLDIDDDDDDMYASITAAAAATTDWSMSTRFLIHENRLLMRVVSQTFAHPGLPPSAKRLLLYNRDDYWPYFSVCPHWRDGELMDVCKCALDHIPTPRNKAGFQGIEHKFKDAMQGRVANFDPRYAVPSQCAKCQPMRRCPRCPSEYLVEVKLAEDTSSTSTATAGAGADFTARPSSSRQVSSNSRPGTSGKDSSSSSRRKTKFRHAIVVTRWTDLGDGSTPGSSEEWASMCDNPDSIPLKPGTGGNLEYDSFKRLGRRGISGIFESAFTHDTIPGKRIVSMNPDNKTGGETRNDWY